MLIRDHYISAIRRMACRFGRESGDHVIPRNATLRRCIDYAANYLYERDTKEHYRYKRYMRALKDLLRYYGDHRKTSRIVHVDVGCGPGVFAWVVHDYFRRKERGTEIELHAYDSCPKMATLARLIWGEFGIDVCLGATSNSDELISQIKEDGSPADVIVSFGHVLVQTSDQEDAINGFADILSAIRPNSSLVVAVDAQSEEAVSTFDHSVDRLIEALATRDLEVRFEKPRWGSFVAVVT